MPDAILFDLDGTLLDSEPDFTVVLNRMLQAQGREPVSAAQLRRVVSAGATAMVREAFGLDEEDPALPQLLDSFLADYLQQIPQTRAGLFADIDLLLANLHDCGTPWGIMTNKARRFSEPLLAQFESFATCATLVCGDDVSRGKPDPAGLLLASERLGLPPQAVLYAGDHPRDIEAAVRAGMPTVAVAWGYLPAEPAIEHWGADIIVQTPLDLLTQLGLNGE